MTEDRRDETHRYPVSAEAEARAWLNRGQYAALRARAEQEPEDFWREVGERLDWLRPFTKISDVSFDPDDLHIRWYEDGVLNVSLNCLDRHLATRGDQVAIVWEGDEPGVSRKLTYRELHAEVCRMANVLKGLGVGRGDRVTIYLPMIPEVAIAMLAAARLGAIHSVVFGGFSPASIAGRILDCGSRLVITADGGRRGGRPLTLKSNVDQALESTAAGELIDTVLVIRHSGGEVQWHDRDVWYHELAAAAGTSCDAEPMNAEDPLFILYTSGSTGKPKGVLHTTGGYLAWASFTHQYVFDYHDGEVFWCTADVGWITGHTYTVYGALANGATTLMFEGVPHYPDHSRFWQICDRHGVNIIYTAPTAIRSLMRAGDAAVKTTSRASLRLLGTVGEPINPEAWEWYHRVVGDGRSPVVDTWWQTETGGILIAPLPGAVDLKPGSATLPLPGIQAALLDTDGRPVTGAGAGNLVLTASWPGQMRTVYGDHARFAATYFMTYPGCYFTGDGARRDKDGYYWITGRVDDVINVSGHRLGTAEIESALVAHPKVAEAAVVPIAHEIKGQGIYAYVTLMAGCEADDTLSRELIAWVREQIGALATIDRLQWAAALPKTRSGKIMRRILRKIAGDEIDQLGDTSTLADPAVVEQLIAGRV